MAIAGLSLIRFIFATTIDLRVDEAYYWTWVREYVLSYLDHPPLIAWLLRLSTSVFGDTNLGVRFPGLLAIALTQCLLGAIIWRMVRDLRYVVAIALMTEASLAFGFGLARTTPDVALIPCELAMFWSLVRLAQSGDRRWWLAAGFFGGLAALAKYTAVLLVPSIAAFVLIPNWRRQQLTSAYLWLGVAIAVLEFSPVLYWNFVHDWVSFRFQLDRPDQIAGWTPKFLLDFVGQQFGLIGIVLFPVVLGGTAMLGWRGYRQRDPIRILLPTAVLFPLIFFLLQGFSRRIGDGWTLFVWPMAFTCALIHLKDTIDGSPMSRGARFGPALMGISIALGIASVVAVQAYYLLGTANYLGKNDPIGKEAGFDGLVAWANAARIANGARWFATTDYRIYSILRWHLRDTDVCVVQVNERSRFIGFAQPALDGRIGLYLGSTVDRDAPILATTSAELSTIGKRDLIWRGAIYDTYIAQTLTNWKPVLSPPVGDPFERAHPL